MVRATWHFITSICQRRLVHQDIDNAPISGVPYAKERWQALYSKHRAQQEIHTSADTNGQEQNEMLAIDDDNGFVEEWIQNHEDPHLRRLEAFSCEYAEQDGLYQL